MSVEFVAVVTNGSIPIPESHRDQIQGPVRVTVVPEQQSTGKSKIQELLSHPLQVPNFKPLTREQAHERG
jgi:hypothetical protein